MRDAFAAAAAVLLCGMATASAEQAGADSARSSADAIVATAIEETGAPAAALIVVGPEGPLALAVGGVRRAGADEAAAVGDAWHIGSNAKAMTAALALLLAEEGTVSLDDTVEERLGATYAVADEWRSVTLRDLLHHRGGVAPNAGRLTMMRYITFGADDESEAAADRRSVLKSVLRRPPPGEFGAFAYSNLGYALAGEMLQEAAGMPFERLLRKRLFEPLDIGSALFGAPDGGEVIRGHTGNPPRPRPGGFDNPLFMSPAGTISLTADDYGRFLTDQLRGQMGLSGLLAPESYELQASPPAGGDYALGWGVRPDGTLGHSGSNTAWFATALIDPDRGIAAALLTNHGGASDLGPYLEDALSAFRGEP